MSRTIATALPVWVAVAGAALAVALLAPREQWWGILPVIAAAAMLLTFVIQVSLQSKDGLVTRMLVTVAGVFLLLAVASLITLLLAGS